MSTKTTATMTESEAKAFVDQIAAELSAEYNSPYVFLCLNVSRYPDNYPSARVEWAADVEMPGTTKGQIRAETLAELTEKLREQKSPAAKLAKIGELRKQADELEASIAKETVGV